MRAGEAALEACFAGFLGPLFVGFFRAGVRMSHPPAERVGSGSARVKVGFFWYARGMECANQKRNAARCTCTYAGCPRHAVCCDCLAYHRGNGELPACYFTAEQERTYDRSIGYFVRVNRR